MIDLPTLQAIAAVGMMLMIFVSLSYWMIHNSERVTREEVRTRILDLRSEMLNRMDLLSERMDLLSDQMNGRMDERADGPACRPHGPDERPDGPESPGDSGPAGKSHSR